MMQSCSGGIEEILESVPCYSMACSMLKISYMLRSSTLLDWVFTVFLLCSVQVRAISNFDGDRDHAEYNIVD